MDLSFVYQCKDAACGHEGVSDYWTEEIPDNSEPTWVPCPKCGKSMEPLRLADETDKRMLPQPIRYCRWGPVFTIRFGPTEDWPSKPAISDSEHKQVSTAVAPSKQQNIESDIIFTSEAARILRTTPSRTTYLARTGVIPAFKVGKKEWRYSREALEEWILMQARKSTGLPHPIPEPSHPKPSVKPKVIKRRRKFPTDLSPEALRKAIQRMQPTESKNR
jgi:excisionase family DNA binding protein